MKSCHALNEGPQNSQTHCSGLVELSCLARHGKSAKEERLLLAKGCEDRPEGRGGLLHVAYAHSDCASQTGCWHPPARQDLVRSFPICGADGDFTAHMAAWHSTITARRMCLRKECRSFMIR